MAFIHHNQVPKNKKVAYDNMVCDHRPIKIEKHRVRLIIGGDVLDYFGDPLSPESSLLKVKLLITIVISNSKKGSRFMILDVKYFSHQSFLEEPEYMCIYSK